MKSAFGKSASGAATPRSIVSARLALAACAAASLLPGLTASAQVAIRQARPVKQMPSLPADALSVDIAADPSVPRPGVYLVNEGIKEATIYATGQTVQIPQFRAWRQMCSGRPNALGIEDLKAMDQLHQAEMNNAEGLTIVNANVNTAGVNIVFVLAGSVPAAAIPAFAAAEAYIESQIPDLITVTITVNFAPLGPGILGGTGSSMGYLSVPASRTGLIAGAGDDDVFNYMPTATIPVQYVNGVNTTENRLIWNMANYKATVGAWAGTDANMTYSTTFPFDYNPADGITAGHYSFRDVVIHETAHALGFTSAIDIVANEMTVWDLFRVKDQAAWITYFNQWKPGFTAMIRHVVPNANTGPKYIHYPVMGPTPIYAVEDGNPHQASHLLQGSGVMSPALAPGVHFGSYNSPARTVLDYVGYEIIGPYY